MGNDACKAGDYRPPDLPEGTLEVRISVYKLEISGIGLIDAIGGGICGAYHSGVVILGQEWAFGGHEEVGKPGVYRSKPELNPDYIFYQRLIMGHVRMTQQEVNRKIKSLALSAEWCGPCYDLFERNCNHFTSDLCWALLGKRPPDWINVTAVGLSRTSRRLKQQKQLLEKELQQYVSQHGVAAAQGASAPALNGKSHALKAPGVLAFEEEFKATFEQAWRDGIDHGLAKAYQCPEGQDPDRLKEQAEREVLLHSAVAARSAATAAARAARAAEVSRAQQPQAGLAAWDNAWRRLSTPLLRSWRQAAIDGTLLPSGEADRDDQVATLLQKAEDTARVRASRRG